MQYKTLLLEIRDNVARITLNRPEANNALNGEMAQELMHASIQCSEDPAVRAVLIAASGKMFSPGGDLKSFAAQGDNLPRHLKEITVYLHAAVSRLKRMDAPLVVAVNGFAAGAGMSLACAGDITLAAESARFTVAYTGVGLSPDGSSSYFLPRLVGMKRALELTLTNRILSAQEALDWGIVTRVVPDAELLPQADSTARELAAGPTKALGASKRLLMTSWSETLETQMEHEAQSVTDMSRTSDARQAIPAFIEKRTPVFRGQ
jgi:2-(1,2-epoxy-1,2-dihydrophenyl)acetyl-CoA isomerase